MNLPSTLMDKVVDVQRASTSSTAANPWAVIASNVPAAVQGAPTWAINAGSLRSFADGATVYLSSGDGVSIPGGLVVGDRIIHGSVTYKVCDLKFWNNVRLGPGTLYEAAVEVVKSP